ncbi:MAG: plastocyanin/azurin family copper-binding protein [Micropepsaceae bacterium]
MTRIPLLTASFVAATLLAVAASASPGHVGSEAAPYGQQGDVRKATKTVKIEASEIKFNVTELKFRVGETVKFVLINKGQQDHELTIGDAAMQQEHRKMMLDMASMPNMDMTKMSGHGHSADSMVTAKPGETKELVWQFTKAGMFEFACNLPGHAEVGMTGKIVVS